MKLGIDLDDVVLDCHTSLALFHNARYGTSYERKDERSWNMEDTWRCTRQEALDRIREWYDSPEHAASQLVPGALEAIRELAKRHELHIVTSRTAEIEALTRAWLSRYFHDEFTAMHFTSVSEPGAGSKAAVCRNLGLAFLVEDALIHAHDVAASGTKVLLFDAPWNQEDISDSGTITRVSGWQGVLGFLGT